MSVEPWAALIVLPVLGILLSEDKFCEGGKASPAWRCFLTLLPVSFCSVGRRHVSGIICFSFESLHDHSQTVINSFDLHDYGFLGCLQRIMKVTSSFPHHMFSTTQQHSLSRSSVTCSKLLI
jgi:hypothetical protein